MIYEDFEEQIFLDFFYFLGLFYVRIAFDIPISNAGFQGCAQIIMVAAGL